MCEQDGVEHTPLCWEGARWQRYLHSVGGALLGVGLVLLLFREGPLWKMAAAALPGALIGAVFAELFWRSILRRVRSP